MSRSWSIPRRFVNIKLFKGIEQKEEYLLSDFNVDANINFSTSASIGGMAYEAIITIHGLTLDKMSYLATSFNAYTNNASRNNSIKVDAGYDNKHSVIYIGSVVNAIPDVNSSDFSIQLRCVSLYNYLSTDAKALFSDGRESFKNLCDKVAKDIGVPLKYEINEDISIDNYYINNSSLFNNLRDLAKTVGADVWIGHDNVMYVKNINKSLDGKPYKIDYTNIIGSPKPDALGCEVAIRMDSTIKSGLKVEIESKRFPSMNGTFFIQSFSHTGETKGNKWQTNLRLTKESIFAK